jgi:hypothetical protein
MEIFGIALFVLVLVVAAATVSAILRDGRGHTPPEHTARDWAGLDQPGNNYTMRIF